jgi:poly-gamma-glutamate synthesis protein (capsule biosynthesis protein)
MEVNGITIAILGYTEYTNCDLTDFSNAEVFYLSDEETLKNQIQAADEIADVVVVSCHYGTEVENELNEQQEELTPKMVEWGADLIIGTQAHTVSTCGYIDKADGSKAFVYYGLGNFIGTMDEPKSQVGLIGKLNVVKNNDTGAVSFEDVKAIPIISHFEGEDYYGEWTNCTVYPYSEYTDELFEKHFGDDFTRQTVEECLSFVPSEFLSIE